VSHGLSSVSIRLYGLTSRPAVAVVRTAEAVLARRTVTHARSELTRTPASRNGLDEHDADDEQKNVAHFGCDMADGCRGSQGVSFSIFVDWYW